MSTGSPCAHVKSSSDGETEQDRPERMRDWLIRMINSGRFPGLVWLDQDKTVFKVPWIHAKKRGYDRKRDAALFKEWAVHSGKYRDESDPTVWKINFRCAINGLKDIVELKDYQTEDCRVYKVLPRTRPIRKRRRSVPRSSDGFPNYSVNPASTTAALAGMPSAAAVWHPGSSYPPTAPSEPYPINSTYQPNMGIPYSSSLQSTVSNVAVANNSCYYYNNSSSPAVPYSSQQSSYSSPQASSLQMNTGMSPLRQDTTVSCMQNNTTSTTPAVSVSTGQSPLAIRRQETPDSGYGGVVDSANSVVDSPLQICPSPDTHGYNSPAGIPSVSSCSGIEQSCSVLPSCGQSIIASPPSPPCNGQTITTTEESIINVLEDLEEKSPHPLSPLHDPPPPNQLNIAVYYGSVQVLNKTVQCTKGCRIYSGQYSQPTTNEQAATFESCFGPLEAEQLSLPSTHPVPEAQQIFDSMNRGLLIEMHENDIYATPLCQTIVYCGTSYYHTSQPLEKERRMKVFDYNEHFQPALEQYSLHRGPAPDPHVIFSLGQLWGPTKPVTQNCVFIVVSHVQAKHDLDVYGPPFSFNHHLFATVSGSVDVRQNSSSDLRAEAFLNTVYPC